MNRVTENDNFDMSILNGSGPFRTKIPKFKNIFWKNCCGNVYCTGFPTAIDI